MWYTPWQFDGANDEWSTSAFNGSPIWNQPQQSHMLYAGMLTRDNRIVSYKWPEIVQNPNISQISDSLSKDIHKQ